MLSSLSQVLFVVFDKAWVLGPPSVLKAYLSTQDVIYQTKAWVLGPPSVLKTYLSTQDVVYQIKGAAL